MDDDGEILSLLVSLGPVCSGAQQWLRTNALQSVEELYRRAPYNWLLWAYRHADYAPQEHTDRAVRLLLEFSGVHIPVVFLQELQARDFDDTRWTTDQAWERLVKGQSWVNVNRVFTRSLLYLHNRHRNNYWLLFDAALLALGTNPFQDVSKTDIQRFERRFCEEYPADEMLERLRSAQRKRTTTTKT